MSDLLGISSSAVTTYQRALGVVSNNIANAATEGYTRQDVSLEASPGQSNGKVYLGTGVIFSAVKRQYDAFVESNLRNSNSDLQSQKPVVDYTNRIVDVMGGDTSGLGSALDQFFGSARALAADPASSVLRGSFLRDADGLASRFHQLSSQLDLVDNETRDAVQSNVTQMNALAGQLASVNQQLGKYRELSRQPAELLDQRDQLLLQLSQFTKLRTQIAENGEVTVSLGASITQDVIVSGKDFTRLSVSYDAASPEQFSLVLDPYGKPKPLTGVNSGSLAGLISFREQVLNSTRGALDNLAQTLAKEVNTIHTQAVDAAGVRGNALFTFDPSQTHASAGLQVAITDTMRVCAASAFRVIEDSNNTGSEDATLRFSAPQNSGPSDLSQVLANNSNIAAAASLTLTGSASVAALASIGAGSQDVTVYLDTQSAGQQFQLLTRDGRHLAGQDLSNNTDLQNRLFGPDNGFELGASYSAQYLNTQGDGSYRGLSVFYGARAAAQQIQQFDSVGNAISAQTQNAVLRSETIAPGFSGLPALDYVRLNGVTLGALSPSDSSVGVQASDVANWVNAAQVNGITASASTEIRVPSNQLQLQQSLLVNGVTIQAPAGGFPSAQGLISLINAKQAQTGVTASLTAQGVVVLRNSTGNNIAIDSTDGLQANALGLSDKLFGGQVQLARAAGDAGNIELGLGTLGSADLLANLGLAPGITRGPEVQTAVLQGGNIGSDWTGGFPSANAFTLNGQALGSLTPSNGSNIQAKDVAAWLNAASGTGVRASAANDIRIPASQLKLQASLRINNTDIVYPQGGYSSVHALAQAISDQQGSSNVRAYVNAQGELVLGNTAGHEGEDITVTGLSNSSPNALGLANGRYGGQVKLERSDGSTAPIELGIGAEGDPAMLAKLGFRTQVHIEGKLPEDMLLFVSGEGTAKLAASYSGSPSDPIDRLRAAPMTLTFDSTTHYTITDQATGSILAEREFNPADPNATIAYQGLSIRFSKPPQAGDRFSIDGNVDGTGDNQAMLDMVDLERKAVVGGKTINAAYIDHVNDMGNIARQATIVQSSLKVVHDQAVSSRDQISGVSLDEEATNLIRFQQAYQASAKVLQVASQLFDSMLQIR